MMYVGGAVALDIFGSLFMHYMTYVLRVGTSLAFAGHESDDAVSVIRDPLFTGFASASATPIRSPSR